MVKCYQNPTKCEMLPAWQKALRTKRLGPARLNEDIAGFLSEKQHSAPAVALETFNVEKVLAIGDVHGDMLALLSALRSEGVVDLDAEWTGGSTFVVQTGDIFDRGGREGKSVNTLLNEYEEIYILQYLYYLDESARKKGGRVIGLTGNHEA